MSIHINLEIILLVVIIISEIDNLYNRISFPVDNVDENYTIYTTISRAGG